MTWRRSGTCFFRSSNSLDFCGKCGCCLGWQLLGQIFHLFILPEAFSIRLPCLCFASSFLLQCTDMALRKLECFSKSIDPMSLKAISAEVPYSCAKLSASAPNIGRVHANLVGALLSSKCSWTMFVYSKSSWYLAGDGGVRQSYCTLYWTGKLRYLNE